MLSEQQQAQFRTQGYLLILDALADIGLLRLRETYERVRQQTQVAWRKAIAADSGNGIYGLGAAAHVMLDLYQYDRLFLDLANNLTIIPIAEAVVGHNRPSDPPGSVNSFSAGPGTQTPLYTGAQLENMPEMKKLTAAAGTAIIWNVALWHTATANTSPRDRRIITCGYTHFWVKQWEDRSPPKEIIAWADTPQKRQLMGIHAVQGRAAGDRHDVACLPEHQTGADAKPF